MASLGMTFDPNTVDPSTGGGDFKLLPVGPAELEIRESEVKPNSKGTGTVAAFVAYHTGLDYPECRDQKVFININLTNESAQAQAIGQGEFSALCAAIGETGTVEDTEQLHFRPFYAELKHETAMDKATGYKQPLMKKDGSGPLLNAVVKRFLFEDGDAPSAPQPPANKPAAQPQTQPQQQAVSGGGRSWQRKSA
jgi:hypothetical protein